MAFFMEFCPLRNTFCVSSASFKHVLYKSSSVFIVKVCIILELCVLLVVLCFVFFFFFFFVGGAPIGFCLLHSPYPSWLLDK